MSTFSIGIDVIAAVFLVIYVAKLLAQDLRYTGGAHSSLTTGLRYLWGDFNLEKRSLLNQHVRRRHS